MNGTVAPSARSFTTEATPERGRLSSSTSAGTGSKSMRTGFGVPSGESPAALVIWASVIMEPGGIRAGDTHVQA
jgi:hypothetical protein